jgi:coenzyme F420 hydrogenase subunit beta
MAQTIMGQKDLKARVQDAGLCTGCGACVNLCPYQVFHHDRTIILNHCDIESGRCWAFCPRTPADLETMRRIISDGSDYMPEIGPVRAFYIVRAKNARLRSRSQHGGTVSALMRLALQEGIIDAAVVAQGGERFLQEPVTVQRPGDVQKRAKSRFIVSPTVAEFNRTARGEAQKIGVVATPCQAFALAKMRLKPELKSGDNPVDKLKFVIGLFCGYTLSWAGFAALLQNKIQLDEIVGMEVPPGEGVLEVYTHSGVIKFPMEEVEPLMRDACRYCIDTTAEYADLSIGSARFSAKWEEVRTWNQVIVRSRVGEELLGIAKKKRILEFHDVPDGTLKALKNAAQKKKKSSLMNLVRKSGSADDLIYLDARDPVLKDLQQGGAHV